MKTLDKHLHSDGGGAAMLGAGQLLDYFNTWAKAVHNICFTCHQRHQIVCDSIVFEKTYY